MCIVFLVVSDCVFTFARGNILRKYQSRDFILISKGVSGEYLVFRECQPIAISRLCQLAASESESSTVPAGRHHRHSLTHFTDKP